MVTALIAGALALSCLITWGVLESRTIARDIDRVFRSEEREE